MEKKKTNRVRMYLILSGLFILLIGCTQINENEENVSQLETEETTNIVKTESIIEMEINEEQNDLTPERFFFQPDENVICVYEGTIEFDSINDKYALYKETAEKDIVFVNMLFVEEETGVIYTWEGENLVSVSIQEAEKLNLPGDSELETEHDWSYENIPESELLDKVMETLQETGHSEKNLIYDGTIDFIHRSYYMVSAFENFEDHIVRGQRYYIDCKNGYIYRVGENADFLRTELYFISDFITETIQSFSAEDMWTFKKLTDNLFEIVQSVGSPARYVFYYDAQTCKKSDVFFNPILIENQYIAYIENGELIIRDIFDEGTFCKKITRDFTQTADPTSAIISITLEKEGQFVIEYYQGEDYKMETEIISE